MLDPLKIHQKLEALGIAWAEANYAAELLEETKKTTLASIINQSQATSHAGKETEALANPLYKNHIELMCKARETANIAKVKYDTAKTWCDLERTQAATERLINK